MFAVGSKGGADLLQAGQVLSFDPGEMREITVRPHLFDRETIGEDGAIREKFVEDWFVVLFPGFAIVAGFARPYFDLAVPRVVHNVRVR